MCTGSVFINSNACPNIVNLPSVTVTTSKDPFGYILSRHQ